MARHHQPDDGIGAGGGAGAAGVRAPLLRLRALRGLAAACGLALVLPALPARAAAVRNGNEFALACTEATATQRVALLKERAGMMHTFRYLAIRRIAGREPGSPAVVLTTTEPSSDAVVVLVVPASQKLSTALAGQLATGECVAARGVIEKMEEGPPLTFRISPALLQFKDRSAPKAGRELLKEVDRGAVP